MTPAQKSDRMMSKASTRVHPASGAMTITTWCVRAAVVGRIMKAAAAPAGQPWLWTLAYGHHEDRTPTHGYEPTREAAMAALGAGTGR